MLRAIFPESWKYMLNKVFFISWFSVLLFGGLLAQTSSIRLQWDLGSENDLYLYRVFRSGSPNAATQIDSVYAPTHAYADKTFQKGVLYYYRLKAVDFSLNASGFSSEVSVAVPKVSGLSSTNTWPADTTVTIQLDSHVDDPDDPDNTITWSITGASNLVVSLANRVATITTPSNWSGQETLSFKASDPGGFNDVQKMIIKSANGVTASAPVFSPIPEQTLNEDGQKTVKLSDYVTDSDSDVNQLSFTATQVNNISLPISGDVMTIKPDANWSGSRQTTITVTDQDGLTDQTTMTITVNAVNDAPVLADLPSVTMPQDSNVVVSLSPYVSDVDNTVSQLSWQFVNYNHVTLTFDDANDNLTITSPADWSGFEYIIVQVSDPSNATASDTLVVRVTSSASQAPQIGTLPVVATTEDQSTTLNLNDYVTDPDDPVENLFWRSGSNNDVQVSVNQMTHVATFTPLENWNGDTKIWLYVSDPAENKDSAQVSVSVSPVNDAPQMQPLPAVNLSSATSASVDLKKYTSDVDNTLSQITWQTVNNQNVTVSIANGIATFSVAETWFGQEEITVYADDPDGARATSAITVYRQDLSVSPQISGLNNIAMDEDSEKILSLDDYVSDPDNSDAELSWTLSNAQNISAVIDNANRLLTLHPAENWNGSEDLFLKVSDPQGHVDFDTLTVTVRPVNDPPQINTIPLITMVANTTYTVNLDNFIIEPDGWDDLAEISILAPSNAFIGHYLDLFNHQLTFFSPAGFMGRETFLLRVTDRAGGQALTVFTVEVSDKQISNLKISFFGAENNLNLDWQTRLSSIDQVQYGESTAYGNETDPDATYSTSHQQQLAGLKANTTYHFRIISESADGSITYSADSVFVTGREGDVNVFPLPYQASLDTQGKGIFFTNLPVSAHIVIYNLLGEPVFRKDDVSTLFRWPVVNNAEKPLSSGLYLYVVKDADNKKTASGKIVIVR